MGILQKSLRHTPAQKLQDAFIAIVAGAYRLSEINMRVRSDEALQRAFERGACADQSVIQETLNACIITEDIARVEYNLSKNVTGKAKRASSKANNVRGIKGATPDLKKPAPPVLPSSPGALVKDQVDLPPDPRNVMPVRDIEVAMTKVVKGLEKIKNLSAETIRDAGINPADLANLANSLSLAGPTTQKLVGEFHNVPGFEQVLLGWRKRSYWNTKLKKPGWKATDAFYTGNSYVMKYATNKLDPKNVRFEWPVSINDARWGDEVFARYVDIVSDGTMVKPGQHIQIELKSWTEFVRRMKTRFHPGKATSYPGTVGYRLLRDTALFEPNNIRWVFDASKKVTKNSVIEAFVKVIANDAYLRRQWGGKDADPKIIRELLDTAPCRI